MEEHNKPSKLSNIDSAHLKKTVVLKWFAQKTKKTLSFLITGKTGVGKSRLVNALVGQAVATEGRERFGGCTDRVTSYSAVYYGIEVLVWDSPGLQDRTVQNEDLYLEDVKQQGFDLMIYCSRMDDTRFTEPDEMAIRTLTRVFGKEVWNKAVIALTFANKIEDPDEGDEEAYFKQEHLHWKEAINLFLRTELCLDSQVVGAIPIIPVGNYRKLRLPTSENWLSELWTSCFLAMDVRSALALYLINQHRLALSGPRALPAAESASSNQGPAALADASEIPQMISLNREQEETLWGRVLEYVTGTSADDRERILEYIAFLATIGVAGLVVLRYVLPR